jgi:SAGA-associated factor 29
LAMWQQLQRDLLKCHELQKKQIEVGKDITSLEETMAKAEPKPTSKHIQQLEDLYREMVKLAAAEKALLNDEPADIRKNLSILQALRSATASEPTRTGPSSKRSKPKISKPEPDVTVDSPGPSPNISTSATRLKGSSNRSGSVASAREIKMEDDDAKGPSAERAGKFFVGAEVAYKQAKVVDGTQWIQCNIISVTESGNKKRYEVQDPEPDEHGDPGQIYKASASQLIAIPLADAVLPDFPVGKHVLARYPETTTFYRAEVMGMKKGICKLKFEEDENQEMEVDRRYVLDIGAK